MTPSRALCYLYSVGHLIKHYLALQEIRLNDQTPRTIKQTIETRDLDVGVFRHGLEKGFNTFKKIDKKRESLNRKRESMKNKQVGILELKS